MMVTPKVAATVALMLCLPEAGRAASFTTIYSFSASGKHSPHYPNGKLKHYGDALYGVTLSDGPCDGYECGAIYRYVVPRGQLEPLHIFTGSPDGSYPGAGLRQVGEAFYGTTLYGGQSGANRGGTIYRFDPTTHAETVLYSFPYDFAGSVYYYPNELIASGASLFGTMQTGLDNKGETEGALFQFDLTSGDLEVLHEFDTKFGSKDGQRPTGSPIVFGQSLFGLTQLGGTAGLGTIYKFDTVTGREKIVHSFADVQGNGNQPADHMVKQDGLFYGVTNYGGANEGGTFFSFEPRTQAFKVLYEFGQSAGDGTLPQFAPVYSNGVFYGTTRQGGTSNDGTVYSFDPASGKETVLYSFTGGTDGRYPADLLAMKGVLYGTTFMGGMSGVGSIYKVVP